MTGFTYDDATGTYSVPLRGSEVLAVTGALERERKHSARLAKGRSEISRVLEVARLDRAIAAFQPAHDAALESMLSGEPSSAAAAERAVE